MHKITGLDFSGKKAIIFGVASDKSIAWTIAKRLDAQGCKLALGYQERVKDFAEPLFKQLDNPLTGFADATNEEQMDEFFTAVKEEFGTVDYLIHSIAFAKKQHLQGKFMDVDRRGWQISQEVSAYSLVDFLRRTAPLMKNGGSCLTLTFGYNRVFPNYNMMGICKAALESAVRYLAYDVGKNNIRVNAISSGPIPTMAASGIKGFDDMVTEFIRKSPLKRLITPEEVANTALFLLSDLSSGITGEVVNVDAGYNVMGI